MLHSSIFLLLKSEKNRLSVEAPVWSSILAMWGQIQLEEVVVRGDIPLFLKGTFDIPSLTRSPWDMGCLFRSPLLIGLDR